MSAAIGNAARHNQELGRSGLTYLSVAVSFLAAAGLIVAVVPTFRRSERGRRLLIALECVAAASGLLSLLNGAAASWVSIALTAVVIGTLTRGNARTWFDLRPAA